MDYILEETKNRAFSISNINGTYQLNCLFCPRKYIVQTGRNLNVKCKECPEAISSMKPYAGYYRHILDTGIYTDRYKNYGNSKEGKKG
jgi:hypothetical protein